MRHQMSPNPPHIPPTHQAQHQQDSSTPLQDASSTVQDASPLPGHGRKPRHTKPVTVETGLPQVPVAHIEHAQGVHQGRTVVGQYGPVQYQCVVLPDQPFGLDEP